MRSSPVIRYRRDLTQLETYFTIREASAKNRISTNNLHYALASKNELGGYFWRYLEIDGKSKESRFCQSCSKVTDETFCVCHKCLKALVKRRDWE